MKRVDRVLFALAEPTRRQMIELLGRAPRRASELADALGASRPAMSRHLRALRAAGLLREEADEEDGRARRLALAREGFGELHVWLDQVEGVWTEQLASFKVVAETTARPRAKRKAS